MIEVSTTEWLSHASQAIDSVLKECHKHQLKATWNENFITSRILQSLQLYSEPTRWVDEGRISQCDMFKLTGHAETNYGDIAVFVRTWFSSKEFVDGVCFYEAKRQYFEMDVPSGFSAFSSAQMKKIVDSTSSCHAVLYDIEPGPQETWATTLPIAHLLAFTSHTRGSNGGRGLHYHGIPFVYPLLSNILGQNLDHRKRLVDAIKEWVIRKEKIHFVISCDVWADLDFKPTPHFIPGGKYQHIRIASPDKKRDSTSSPPPP
ncbi:hypothetical protein K5D53_02885 [Pseudomonas cichorii]|nr:hypothetical protein [Pseudomonas cichorii]MBX8595684.1 hypothetical protein [Pseudomonas cichorii]MBX8616755.1 hypothetical protein [Pseudomonas cichorii]